jgi:ribosome-binding ATPase YchF (GTP1/OBG family)
MPNLETLKSRVERAERNLKSAETTRDMESQALVEMWRQIRERFENQESEIQLYRDKLTEVEVEHKQLLKLVETLLGVMEKSSSRSAEDAVPRITGLAEAMLEGRAVASAEPEDDVNATIEDEPPLRKPRAKRDMRDLVSRVAEARRGSTPLVESDDELDIADPDDDMKELEALRAELDDIGGRLGAKR